LTILENILNTVSSKKSFNIPAGMTVAGTFTVDVPGQIAGTVNGDVLVNGRLVILKNGVVNGNVKAEELEILGSVTGDIQCSGKMILQNACFVKGNISTIEIQIEKDAVIDGIITKPDANKTELGFTPGITEDSSTEIIEIDEEPEPLIPAEEPVLIIKAEEEELQSSWF
jgi:cytoskeletal protein CcmA (bactofilin family)